MNQSSSLPLPSGTCCDLARFTLNFLIVLPGERAGSAGCSTHREHNLGIFWLEYSPLRGLYPKNPALTATGPEVLLVQEYSQHQLETLNFPGTSQ